jgi:hypothetical protein
VLHDHPDREAVKTLQTEAALKAQVPGWLAQLKSRNFAGAARPPRPRPRGALSVGAG